MKHQLILFVLTLLTSAIGESSVLSADVRKPHIVFILSDDQGSYDVSYKGGEIRTPEIDKLAMSGTQLDQFYVQPVCTPTRASLMTGRYPIRYGLQVGVIRPWAKYGLPLEERLLPVVLRENGYRTIICGKWHLGSFDQAYWPMQRGFDSHTGHLFGAIDYFTHVRDKEHDWYVDGVNTQQDGYSTHLITQAAVDAIEQNPPEQPLFLYVPFNAVHGPYQVPDRYKTGYEHLKGNRLQMAGMLRALDEGVGQIVSALERAGMRENTLLIFSSDNGGVGPNRITSNGPLRDGKGTVYEGGVRAVAFATWPGHIPAGEVCREPIHMVDWYPTLIHLIGGSLEQPLPLDGMDIWPVITQKSKSPHKEILNNATPAGGAIRVGDWKLVIKTGNGQGREAKRESVELYNLIDDPSETSNIAAENPEKVQQLTERFLIYSNAAASPKNSAETTE
ncbi:MAG: arylsulfatase [Planctomyces sp.]|nr:arylsulfatase [Planctomyces sp.]